MPALPSVSSGAKAVLRWIAPGVSDVLMNLFFEWAGTMTNAALNTWCANVAAAWGTSGMGALQPVGVNLSEVTAEDLTTPTGPVGAWSGSHPGTRAAGEYAPALAFIIKDIIARRYRGGHPRNYLIGVDPAHSAVADGNTWDPTFAGTVVTNWNAFITAITGSGGPSGTTTFVQCNVSYYKGFTSVQDPVTLRYRNIPTLRQTPLVDLVVGHTYNPQFGSQRRRNKQQA